MRTDLTKALGVLLAVMVLYTLLLVATRQDGRESERLEQAERNGVRVAQIARDRRAAALRAVARFHASAPQHATAIARTDTTFARLPHLLDTLSAVSSDSTTRPATLVGAPIPPTDSVVTVGFARRLVDIVLDSARAAVLNERASAQLRLGLASVAIDSLTRALTASEQVVTAKDSVITALKRQQHGVARRVLDGLVTVAAGGTCGAIGLLAGPGVAFGAASGCIVLVTVAR